MHTKFETDAAILAVLQREFEPHQIQHRPGQGRSQLSYVSHGLVTERLTEADPAWRSDVVEVHKDTDAQGRQHCVGVTLTLTLRFPESGPVSRTETGAPQRMSDFATEVKVAQSDALKRAAMRFGVGLSMWEKLIDSQIDEDGPYRGPQPQQVVNGSPVGRAALERPVVAIDPHVLTEEQARAIQRLRQDIQDEVWVGSVIAGANEAGSLEPGDLDRRGASSVIKQLSKRAADLRKESAPPRSA